MDNNYIFTSSFQIIRTRFCISKAFDIISTIELKFLLGQLCVLQLRVEEDDPAQDFPEYFGSGLVQVLLLVCCPPPHVTEHGL